MPRARRHFPALAVAVAACALLPLAQMLGTDPALANPGAAQAQPTNAQLSGVACASASSCEAVGAWIYQSTPTFNRTLAEHWNGTKWTVQKTPDPDGSDYVQLQAVACPASSNCNAVGYYYPGEQVAPTALHWNGSKWSSKAVPLPSGALNGELAGIACVKTTDCIAVGYYVTSSYVLRSLAEHWNGSKWSLETAGLPKTYSFLSGISCPGKTRCYAVGAKSNSGLDVNFTELWNGSKWSTKSASAPAGVQSSGLDAVACQATTRCLAVGNTLADSDTVRDTLAQHWNGSKWKLSLPVNPSTAADITNYLYGVACPGTTCTAVGNYELSSGAETTLAEHWNGSKWTVVKTANSTAPVGNQLRAIACTSTSKCVAVGYSQSNPDNTGYATLAEHWNGSKWTLMKMPAPSS